MQVHQVDMVEMMAPDRLTGNALLDANFNQVSCRPNGPHNVEGTGAGETRHCKF